MLRWLLGVVAPQRALLAGSFVLPLVHSACRLAQPWLVMLAIDDHLGGVGLAYHDGLLAKFAIASGPRR